MQRDLLSLLQSPIPFGENYRSRHHNVPRVPCYSNNMGTVKEVTICFYAKNVLKRSLAKSHLSFQTKYTESAKDAKRLLIARTVDCTNTFFHGGVTLTTLIKWCYCQYCRATIFDPDENGYRFKGFTFCSEQCIENYENEMIP